MTQKITHIFTALFTTMMVASVSNVANAADVDKDKNANLIAEAEKQPGTHPQVNKIRSKLNQSKKQILEMELATQIKSCDVAMAKLNSMKQQQQTQ